MFARWIAKFSKNENGAAAVFFALAFVTLLLVASLVLDFGNVYIQAGKMQNTADSAALAAVTALPCKHNDTGKIELCKALAIQYAAKNGMVITNDNITISTNANNVYTTVKVQVGQSVPMMLTPLAGLTHKDITRSATASVSCVTALTGAAPLSVTKTVYEYAKANNMLEHLTLKFDGGEGVAGSYGAIDLDALVGGGAQDYANWLAYGFPGTLSVGDVLPTENGNMAGPTFDAYLFRYNSCTHFPGQGGCTVDHYVSTCQRIVTVPVITYISSHVVKVEGFSSFLLEGSTGNQNKGEVFGSYLTDVQLHNTSTNDYNIVGGEYDFGIYNRYLSQ